MSTVSRPERSRTSTRNHRRPKSTQRPCSGRGSALPGQNHKRLQNHLSKQSYSWQCNGAALTQTRIIGSNWGLYFIHSYSVCELNIYHLERFFGQTFSLWIQSVFCVFSQLHAWVWAWGLEEGFHAPSQNIRKYPRVYWPIEPKVKFLEALTFIIWQSWIRFRDMPTFGRDSIRRFTNNVSELKKLGARDYENLLQVSYCTCPIQTLWPNLNFYWVLYTSFRRATARATQH